MTIYLSYKKITAIIAIVALLPILLVPDELWDGVFVSMAHSTQDFSFIKEISLSLGLHLTYYLRVVINEITLATGIPQKLFTNTLAVIATLGIARETYRYFREQFKLSEYAAYVGAWTILAFPLWHILLISGLQIRMLYVWLFMIAVNMWPKNKVLATLILLPSLQFYSLFPLAVGVLWTDFVMTAEKSDWLNKGTKAALYSACLLLMYIALTKIVSVNGIDGNYNRFNLNEIESFVHFGITICVVLVIWFGLNLKMQDKQDSIRLLRLLVAFLTLYFFAGLAYWVIGRPLRFFSFGSFGSRHAVLTCLSIALLLSTLAEYGFKYWKKKISHGITAFLITTSLVLLYQGYNHKVAALIFRDILTKSFEMTSAPESGYVSIKAEGYKPPRHVHAYAVNMCLFNAYGKAAWMANGFWARRGFDYDKASLKEIYDTYSAEDLKQRVAYEVTADNFTHYALKLNNFHQEGRFWYWHCYLTRKYACFNPELVKL